MTGASAPPYRFGSFTSSVEAEIPQMPEHTIGVGADEVVAEGKDPCIHRHASPNHRDRDRRPTV